MKFILKVFILLLIFLFFSYHTNLFFENHREKNQAVEKIKKAIIPAEKKKINESNSKVTASNSLSKYIGQPFATLKKKYGEPTRIDKSPYGHENYIYNQKSSTYMIVGVQKGEITTIYVMGEKLNLTPYKIGMTIEKVFTHSKLQSEIAFYYKNNFYRFELSESDLNIRPIVSLGSGTYAQLNFDRITSKLVSIRYLSKLSLIKMHPYELNYQGDIFEEKVSEENWQQINQANDKQVLEITNIIRARHGVKALMNDSKVAGVAYKHSVDMARHNYFDHVSPISGTLTDRMERAGIAYSKVGENIAYNYLDAGAAVEGWLNSEGHRKNLLEKKYTHMGEGTYKKYFTQNFLMK